jgi:phage terminase large subunit
MERIKTILNYRPWSPQEKFHNSLAKFRGFIGGLGSGKTLCGAVESIITALDYKGSLGVILAPTYRMLCDSTIRTFLEICPHDLIERYNRSEQHMTLIDGSEILFRPGDDAASIDHLRNINVDWFWMDEGSMFLRYAWQILIGRLRGQTGPRRGWVTTTPKGYGWTWEKFVSKATKDYFYITASSLDNPYLPEDYKKSLLEEYTGVFARQEIYGQFVGFEGCVYPEFNRAIHVIDTSQHKFEAILAGVDFGFTNPSVILKIGIDYDGRLYVLDEFYERHVTDSALAEYAKNNFKDVEFFIADSENPSAIQEFKNLDMECKGVKKQVAEPRETFVISGIKRISNLLIIRGDGRPRLYVDQKCVNTIMEFENYRYPEKTEEMPEKEAPLKVFDHALDALRYVVTTLGEEFDKIIFLEGENEEKK